MVTRCLRSRPPFQRAIRRLLSVAIGVGTLLSVAAGVAVADESIPVASYDVQETYTIRVNELGDAHFTNVLVYDDSFFETAGKQFEQYPQILSRRYRRDAAFRELQNFKSTIDKDKATVTLTFDQPGFAYNMGSYWMIPLFPDAPTSEENDIPVFEEEILVNNDFTLWQDLTFKTVTKVDLPTGATNVRWDRDEQAVLYELAYVPPKTGNLLQRNSTVFAIVFAALATCSLVAAALLLLRLRSSPSTSES